MHVLCRTCAWSAAYGAAEPMPWVDLGLPADRVRAYVAAGVTADEAAGTHDAAALATLAALRNSV